MSKQITCDAPDCSFKVQTATTEEAAQYARQHAEQYHGAELSIKQAKEMAREI